MAKKENSVQKAANKAGVGSMVQPIIMLCLATLISLLMAFLNIFPYSMSLVCEYAKEHSVQASVASMVLPADISDMCDNLGEAGLVISPSGSRTVITPTYDSTKQYGVTPDPDSSNNTGSPGSPGSPSTPSKSCSADPALNDVSKCSAADKLEKLDLDSLGIQIAKKSEDLVPYLRTSAVDSFKAIFAQWQADNKANPTVRDSIQITSMFRSEAYQAVLRQNHLKYGVCYEEPARYSAHSTGLAFDVSAANGKEVIAKFAETAKAHGWRWLGQWDRDAKTWTGDVVHFDYTRNSNRGCAEGETIQATIHKICIAELGCA